MLAYFRVDIVRVYIVNSATSCAFWRLYVIVFVRFVFAFVMEACLMKILSTLIFLAFVTACSHPLEIVGEGDIVSSTGTNDCSLEEQPCDNYVTGDYKVTYMAVPRSGWGRPCFPRRCWNVVTGMC